MKRALLVGVVLTVALGAAFAQRQQKPRRPSRRAPPLSARRIPRTADRPCRR